MCLFDSYADYGTILEIRDVEYTPDGRAIVNTVGSRRFKIVSKSARDGYNTAAVEFLEVGVRHLLNGLKCKLIGVM